MPTNLYFEIYKIIKKIEPPTNTRISNQLLQSTTRTNYSKKYHSNTTTQNVTPKTTTLKTQKLPLQKLPLEIYFKFQLLQKLPKKITTKITCWKSLENYSPKNIETSHKPNTKHWIKKTTVNQRIRMHTEIHSDDCKSIHIIIQLTLTLAWTLLPLTLTGYILKHILNF